MTFYQVKSRRPESKYVNHIQLGIFLIYLDEKIFIFFKKFARANFLGKIPFFVFSLNKEHRTATKQQSNP